MLSTTFFTTRLAERAWRLDYEHFHNGHAILLQIVTIGGWRHVGIKHGYNDKARDGRLGSPRPAAAERDLQRPFSHQQNFHGRSANETRRTSRSMAGNRADVIAMISQCWGEISKRGLGHGLSARRDGSAQRCPA